MPIGVCLTPGNKKKKHRTSFVGIPTCLVLLILCFPADTTRAGPTRSFPAQFVQIAAPDLKSKSRYRLYVVGDSLANDVAFGLRWALRRDRSIRVRKKTKPATGLVRRDRYNWHRAISRLVRRRKPDILIVSLGGNDRQDIRTGGKRLPRFTVRWRNEYRRRIARLADRLRRSGAAVYWLGLPIVRSNRMSRDFHQMNRIYQAVARSRSFKYVDVSRWFRTSSGKYTAFGRDVRGKVRRLRKKDGRHFTIAGAKRLGLRLASVIRADIRQARRR